MKKQIILLAVAGTLACCPVANATITGASWQTGSDGNLFCQTWGWNSGTSTLWMYGNEYGTPAQPGPGLATYMLGSVQTDTISDPTLFLGSSVDNDTGGTWIGYQVNVVMSVPFTFVGTPSVSTVPSDSWFLANTPTVALQGAGPYLGKYEGTMNFAGGTPLGVGDEIIFNYAINFSSSTDYAFTQEMIPQFSVVPEPNTLVLAGMGSLVLALRFRRNRA